MPKNPLPSNVEAEQAFLGAILLDSSVLRSLNTLPDPSDFLLERHRWIWDGITALTRQDKPIDFVSVTSVLTEQNKLNAVGGAAYLTELLSSVPTASHAAHYIDLVMDAATRRKLIEAATRITELAFDYDTPANELHSSASQVLFNNAPRSTRQFRSMGEIVASDRTNIQDALEHPREVFGIATGFSQFNRLLGGWQRDGYYVIVGNSSVGKTFFLLSILLNLAYAGHGSGLVSLEMSGKQLKNRLLGIISGIPTDYFLRGAIEMVGADGKSKWRRFTPQEKQQMDEAQDKLASLPIYIADDAVGDATQMRIALLNLVAMHPDVEFGALDYLQLMRGSKSKGTRNDELASESRELKLLTKRMPVFALSQKNRDNERRDDAKTFRFSDIRDSGGIPQDADVLINLTSDDYTKAQNNELFVPDNKAEAYIAKDRITRGAGKRVMLEVDPLTKYFRDATDVEV